MSQITVKLRLKPFSHRPGVRLLLPGTTQVVQVFPTHALIDGKEQAHDVGYERFTVVQDLERARILVSGSKSRYLLEGKAATNERLALGCHKKQDWELITRRLDLREILPFWFRLGQLTPAPEYKPSPSLLESERWLDAFRAGFSDLLLPRNTDEDHHGFDLPPIEGDPLALLTRGSELIRSLFVQEGETLALLPNLHPQLHSGRMTGLQTGWGTLDIEWSKKLLRRITLLPTRSGELHLTLQNALKSFRVNGQSYDRDAPVSLEAGQLIRLDRFQK